MKPRLTLEKIKNWTYLGQYRSKKLFRLFTSIQDRTEGAIKPSHATVPVRAWGTWFKEYHIPGQGLGFYVFNPRLCVRVKENWSLREVDTKGKASRQRKTHKLSMMLRCEAALSTCISGDGQRMRDTLLLFLPLDLGSGLSFFLHPGSNHKNCESLVKNCSSDHQHPAIYIAMHRGECDSTERGDLRSAWSQRTLPSIIKQYGGWTILVIFFCFHWRTVIGKIWMGEKCTNSIKLWK